MSDPSNLILEVVLTPTKHANATAANNSNNTNEYNSTGDSPSDLGAQSNEMIIEKWRVTLVPQEESEAGTGASGGENGVTPKTGAPPIMMTPRNLHTAVRSFLHFSQLAAWLSKKKEFTSAWKVRIDMAESGVATASCAVREGWDRHEFPAVTLESQSFWDSHSNIHYAQHKHQRGWSKGPRSNSKWILKVSQQNSEQMLNSYILNIMLALLGPNAVPFTYINE